MEAKELKTRVTTKRRIRRMRQYFFFYFSAPIGNKTESVDCGHHRTPFDIFLFRFPGWSVVFAVKTGQNTKRLRRFVLIHSIGEIRRKT